MKEFNKKYNINPAEFITSGFIESIFSQYKDYLPIKLKNELLEIINYFDQNNINNNLLSNDYDITSIKYYSNYKFIKNKR